MIAAKTPDEPQMPGGVDASALLLAVMGIAGEDQGVAWWRWLTVEHPSWGRELASRLDAARKAAC